MNQQLAQLRAVRQKTATTEKRSVVYVKGDGSVSVDGIPLKLTPVEQRVLQRLAMTPGTVVDREELCQHTWNKDYSSHATNLRGIIWKLRRILPVTIDFKWRVGYAILDIVTDAANGGMTPAEASMTISVVDASRAARTHITRGNKTMPTALPSISRNEELGVIERFLAERGATPCPDVGTLQNSPLPTLIRDKQTKKWRRPSS